MKETSRSASFLMFYEDGSLIMSADQLLDVIRLMTTGIAINLRSPTSPLPLKRKDGSNPGSIETVDESGDFVFTPAENWNGTVFLLHGYRSCSKLR